MWSKEYIFHDEGEKFLTMNHFDFTPRTGDYVNLPLHENSYRVIYSFQETEPFFNVLTNILTSVCRIHIFLRQEVHPNSGDIMKSGKSSYILIDENDADTIVIDLSKDDEWNEPTRPRNRIVDTYRAAPTFRDFNTGLSPLALEE